MSTDPVTETYWPMRLLWAGMLLLSWFALRPRHPFYALMVVMWTLILRPGVAGPVVRRLPRHWFRVPPGERVLRRMLGLGIFRWLLEWFRADESDKVVLASRPRKSWG